MDNRFDRREFLHRAVLLIPAMHAGGLLHAQPKTMSVPSEKDIGRFARLKLRSHRLAEMLTFYRDTLGLRCREPREGVIEVIAGNTVIEFSQADGATEPFYHFAFNIPHNKLEDAIEWMKPRAELIKRGNGEVIFHFPAWDAHAIYFLDPSGNIVEFIARHTLKNDAPGDFGVPDILYASEIGVVTPDVNATAAQFKQTLSLEQYKFASDEFAPIGDEGGLFIVVKTGRIWFPPAKVAKSAEIFEATALVRDSMKADLKLPAERFSVSVQKANS